MKNEDQFRLSRVQPTLSLSLWSILGEPSTESWRSRRFPRPRDSRSVRARPTPPLPVEIFWISATSLDGPLIQLPRWSFIHPLSRRLVHELILQSYPIQCPQCPQCPRCLRRPRREASHSPTSGQTQMPTSKLSCRSLRPQTSSGTSAEAYICWIS